MKIAMCVCCHLRTYDRCHENLKRNVIAPMQAAGHQVDVFLHTWDSRSNYSNKSWWSDPTKNTILHNLAIQPVTSELVKSIYNVKDFLIEHQPLNLPTPDMRTELDLVYVSRAYESANKALYLSKKHGNYDVTFLTRPDINYTTKIDVKELEYKCLMTPPHNYFLAKGGLSDVWLFGPTDIISKSLEMYWHFESIAMGPDREVHFEDSWHKWILKSGITVGVSRLNFTIPRLIGPDSQINFSYEYKGPAKHINSIQAIPLVNNSMVKESIGKVSVIVPCFNYGHFLIECINSIKNQTYKNIEIIIINPSSTDQLTNKLCENLKLLYESIKVFNIPNKGLSDTRNYGMTVSKGEYVICIDADDTLEPTYVEKCKSILDKEPRVGIAFSQAKYFYHKIDDILYSNLDIVSMKYNNKTPSCAMFKRTAYLNVFNKNKIGWDSKYDNYFEDWVMWLEMMMLGWDGKCIPEKLINVREHGENMQNNKERWDKLYHTIIEFKKSRYDIFKGKLD